jgi:hypothetical protein
MSQQAGQDRASSYGSRLRRIRSTECPCPLDQVREGCWTWVFGRCPWTLRGWKCDQIHQWTTSCTSHSMLPTPSGTSGPCPSCSPLSGRLGMLGKCLAGFHHCKCCSHRFRLVRGLANTLGVVVGFEGRTQVHYLGKS